MTLRVEVDSELQAELERQAAAQGVGLEDYAAHVLKTATHCQQGGQLGPRPLEITLAELAQFSQKIPSLPDEAFSRESLYRNHD